MIQEEKSRKKIKVLGALVIFMALLALALVNATNADNTINTNKPTMPELLDCYLQWVKPEIEKTIWGMDAVIDGIHECTGDDDSTLELEYLRDDFKNKYSNLETYSIKGNRRQFEETLNEMKEIRANFERKTRRDFGRCGPDIRKEIHKAITEYEAEFNSLVDDAWNTRRTVEIEFIDWAIDRMGNLTDRLSNCSDTGDLEDILLDLSDERDKLDIALGNQDRQGMKSAERNLRESWMQFKRDAREDIEICRLGGLESILEKADNLILRAEIFLNKLEDRDVDVPYAREKLDEVKSYVENARTAYNSGDHETAVKELKDARNAMIEFRKIVIDSTKGV